MRNHLSMTSLIRLHGLILLTSVLLPCWVTGAAPEEDLNRVAAPEVPPPDVPEEVFPGVALVRLSMGREFDSPVMLATMPGGEGEQVVAQQRGEFCAVNLNEGSWRPFLDLRERMKGILLFEEGVHGIAFHPEFSRNRLFYLSYTQNEPRRTVISEMRATEGALPKAVPETERILMELQQPLADHWGGHLAFGPDGMLYVAMGDGGMRDDPCSLASNPWVLHGKILRMDVNKRDGALPYGIPSDNPFASEQTTRKEIYALGLRNPWGLSFDSKTGRLWCADVGQDLWEEINLIRPGGNYGWSHMEGRLKTSFHPRPLLSGTVCVEPVHAYSRLRGEGICIVGGLIYRGDKLPELEGDYLFADWGYGHVWALEMDAGQQALRRLVLHRGPAQHKFNPTLVVADAEGEPVVLSQDGAIYRLEARAED
jgi:glucose/arabinose dehydrogenase